MKMVPIDVNNIDFIRLDLSRHYIQIDCDFVCYVVLNPSGTIPVGGTDVCAFHVGAWQVDAWKFLTKDFAQIPGFSACLVWDKSKVGGIYKAPQVAESDIDTANSISSLKGQPVNITGFSMADGESLPVETLEGKSLNVSTLEDEFCNVKNVKPVEVYNSVVTEKRSKLVTSNECYVFKIGDSINFDDYPDLFDKIDDNSAQIKHFCFYVVSAGQMLRVNNGKCLFGNHVNNVVTVVDGICSLHREMRVNLTNDGVLSSVSINLCIYGVFNGGVSTNVTDSIRDFSGVDLTLVFF